MEGLAFSSMDLAYFFFALSVILYRACKIRLPALFAVAVCNYFTNSASLGTIKACVYFG